MKNRARWGLGLTALALTACNSGSHRVTSPRPSAPATQTSSRPPAHTSPPVSTYPDWPTYHRVNTRTGYDPTMPAVGTKHTLVWNVALDGAAYAEPLVVNDTAIVATENNTVYAIKNNKVVWKRHLASSVALSALPCGNIDPLGITGTPVYAGGTVYAVAETSGSAGIEHRLYALSASSGAVRWTRAIDPPGSAPRYQQQRAALVIVGGRVWVALGGLWGDCGPYHGWLIGVRTDNTGVVYKKVGATRAGIWAASGPAADGSGNVYVAVGNGTTDSAYDDSDSVLKFRGTNLISFFAPMNWQQENIADADLGSQGPVLLPHGLVFSDGKGGTAYLLRQSNLGGIGHPAHSRSLCSSYGGPAYFSGVIYVPCNGGLQAVQITSGPALGDLWQLSATGSPVIGGGHLWLAATDGRMYEVNAATGAVQASWSLPGGTTRFTTPTLHGKLVIVGTKTSLVAYQMS